ncbi:hypothetical protein Golax_016953 [Gossypium laxum]|uniref:Uncharacterized protein n=1 Tax=Gossypium laxum TaxID=34288 RepID=A0A7J8YYW7_9ROSI|nr:hypothetical protein [Gossypium laxum]
MGENVVGTSLVVPQMLVSKSEIGDTYGGVVEVKRPNNRSYPPSDSTSTILSDTDKYYTILKNKLHQAYTAVALSYLGCEGRRFGEPNVGFSAISTTQKMPGTQLRQAITGTNDKCTVMGKVLPNEYSFNGVPVANDPVDDFHGILGDSVVGNLMAATLYYVHWYSVRFDNPCKTAALDYLGSELFRSSSIIYACCSPHIPEESAVLLENGVRVR